MMIMLNIKYAHKGIAKKYVNINKYVNIFSR